MKQYGYYLAATKEMRGDTGLAVVACERWADLHHPNPQPLDGCSIWIDDSGTLNVRLLARDFFSTTPRVAQAMILAS